MVGNTIEYPVGAESNDGKLRETSPMECTMTLPPHELSPKSLVKMSFFSSTAGRRELQFSAIPRDVWLHDSNNAVAVVDLLITPQSGIPAGRLAKKISARLAKSSARGCDWPVRGRERSFQGHGMLDILRAFQKR